MGAQLTRIDDPRDNLEKMTRDELFHYAKENGVALDPNMPAIDYTSHPAPNMVTILRAKGLRGVDMSRRFLGFNQNRSEPVRHDPTPPVPNEITSKPATEPAHMSIRELRQECTRRGVKMERTDNIARLREKLSGA